MNSKPDGTGDWGSWLLKYEVFHIHRKSEEIYVPGGPHGVFLRPGAVLI